MSKLIEINPHGINPIFDVEGQAKVRALAERQQNAAGLIMRFVTSLGGQIETGLQALPKSLRKGIEAGARKALQRSYDMAGRTHSAGPLGRMLSGDRAHKALASASGALGGVGGMATALVELPVTTTMIFRAVQNVAASYGEDPALAQTRIEVLRVFASGGPTDEDDGINTSFLGARLALTGPAVNNFIAAIAPRFAALFSQKLATQAVPVLGAAAGAGTNFVFMRYYIEMAHVHFGLRALAREYGEEKVLTLFHRTLAQKALPLQ